MASRGYRFDRKEIAVRKLCVAYSICSSLSTLNCLHRKHLIVFSDREKFVSETGL